MKVKIFLVIATLSISNCFSQIKVSSIYSPRKEISIDPTNKSRTVEYPNTDIEIESTYNLLISKETMWYTYTNSVFSYTEKGDNPIYYLRQWSVPLVVYFDEKVPNKIKKELKTYFEKFNTIDNLSISFTNSIEESNYLIEITDDFKKPNISNYTFYNDVDRSEFVFNNGNYSIIGDSIKKSIGCKTSVDLSLINNPYLLKKTIKQLFYLSLGRFFINKGEKNRKFLIGTNYEDSNIPDDLSLKLLEIHYANIYEQKIDKTDFFRLVNLYKKE